MHKIIFFLFIVTTINLSAQENKWMLIEDESFIQYSAKHLLHKWSGTNKNIKGVFLQQNDSKIAVSANIADFDSGISNRDSNALRVLNALNYPQVKFYSADININSDKITFNGELDFHGKKIQKYFEGTYVNTNDKLSIVGEFSVVLTDFDIKLPSLMLVKMDDFADIEFKLIFEKTN